MATQAMKEITDQMISDLRKPLPVLAITQHPTKTYLSSIKPPYVIERLNEVFGLNGWRDEYEIVSAEKERRITKKGTPAEKQFDVMIVVAKGTLRMDEYGIIRTAYGGNDQEDFGDAYKGACTDCLTKMAMQVGIGMDVYKGLGTRSDYKPEPAKTTQYQTIEGIMEEKKGEEHGYWFKVSGKPIFKDERSPVDALPLWEAEVGSVVKIRVIERKNGEKAFFELVDIFGEPKSPLQVRLEESVEQAQAKKAASASQDTPQADDSKKVTYDASASQEQPVKVIHVAKAVEPKNAGKMPFIISGFDEDNRDWTFSSFHKNQWPDLLTATGKECEFLYTETVKGDKTYYNLINWIRIGTRQNADFV